MHLSTLTRRVAASFATAALGAGTLIAVAPSAQAGLLDLPSPQSQVEPQVGYLAQAYGTYAYNTDRTLSSGPTAYTQIACTAEPDKESTNNTAKSDLGKIGQVGATETKTWTEEEGSERASVSQSETGKVNLLNGAITADALTSTSRAVWDGNDYRNESTSDLTNLEVLGVPVKANAGPNTKLELKLPGLGTVGKVEVNKQEVQKKNGEYQVATTALHVEILSDVKAFGLKAGTHLWIGQSRSHLTEPKVGYFLGNGYSTEVNALDGAVQSGRTSAAALPCTGGDSHNSVANVDVPNVAKAGAAETTAKTSETDQGDLVGKTVNNTAGLDVLDGTVEVDTIKTQANAQISASDGQVKLDTNGSKLAGVKINGKPVAEADLGLNSEIKAGPVTVTLNKVNKTDTTIERTAVEVTIDKKGVANLPVGSKITVGYAKAGFAPAQQ